MTNHLSKIERDEVHHLQIACSFLLSLSFLTEPLRVLIAYYIEKSTNADSSVLSKKLNKLLNVIKGFVYKEVLTKANTVAF